MVDNMMARINQNVIENVSVSPNVVLPTAALFSLKAGTPVFLYLMSVNIGDLPFVTGIIPAG